MVDADRASAADDPAEVVLGFANTHDHGGRRADRFDDAEGLQDWLRARVPVVGDAEGLRDWLRAKVPVVGDADHGVVTTADVAEAREIRDALVTVLVTHACDAVATEDDLSSAEHVLRRATQRYPLQAVITRAGAGLVSTQPGLAGVLGAVIAAVVELSQSGAWLRVKACRNCRHGFTDNSRNGSAAFCSAQCRSQSGMRAYRSRRRGDDRA